MRISQRMLAFVALTGFIGCGGGASDMPEVGGVTGKVTLDGRPLAGASLLFHPTSGGRSSTGRTDEEGNYTLQYNSDTPGAKTGEHEVTISTFQDAADTEDGEFIPGREEEVPKKYSSTEMLKVDVKAGENVINLDLTS